MVQTGQMQVARKEEQMIHLLTCKNCYQLYDPLVCKDEKSPCCGDELVNGIVIVDIIREDELDEFNWGAKW